MRLWFLERFVLCGSSIFGRFVSDLGENWICGLYLDGFDILGQLSNVTQTLNGQGRYETWRNVIPSYAMLRLAYNLDIKPAKRRGE